VRIFAESIIISGARQELRVGEQGFNPTPICYIRPSSMKKPVKMRLMPLPTGE
jgi:hypothetical protein